MWPRKWFTFIVIFIICFSAAFYVVFDFMPVVKVVVTGGDGGGGGTGIDCAFWFEVRINDTSTFTD